VRSTLTPDAVERFAGDVVRAPCGVMHGKTSPVFHINEGLLEGLDR
jgi:anthranilate synthase component 2